MDFSSVQSYLRASARAWRECHQIGPFLASFSRSSRNPFVNYAIPDEGATPSEGDVRALISAYRNRGLPARLEYIPDIAPAVEPALVSAGFAAEGRLALMSFPGSAGREDSPPPGFELIAPSSDADLLAVRMVQHEAYGEPEPPGPAAVASLREGLDSGAIAILARTVDGHTPVGAGEYTRPIDGVTEITSIGVRSAYRRRGVAAAMTGWLVRRAVASGVTNAFLMADEDEERIYARVGFVTEGRVLHIRREP